MTTPARLREIAEHNENAQWADMLDPAIDELREAADEIERLQAIVDGADAASKGDYVVEYGWNSDQNQMGYWWGTRGSFVSDRLTWAGTSRLDAWLVIGKKEAEKARQE